MVNHVAHEVQGLPSARNAEERKQPTTSNLSKLLWKVLQGYIAQKTYPTPEWSKPPRPNRSCPTTTLARSPRIIYTFAWFAPTTRTKQPKLAWRAFTFLEVAPRVPNWLPEFI
jgi:hypothetical protein